MKYGWTRLSWVRSALVYIYLYTPTFPQSYNKRLIAKTQEFIQQIRWKDFLHLNPNENYTPKPTYGFKTNKTAPQIKEIQNFENDLYELVNNIQFTNFHSPFQRKLNADVKKINRYKNVYLIIIRWENQKHLRRAWVMKITKNSFQIMYQVPIRNHLTYTTIEEINIEAS